MVDVAQQRGIEAAVHAFVHQHLGALFGGPN